MYWWILLDAVDRSCCSCSCMRTRAPCPNRAHLQRQRGLWTLVQQSPGALEPGTTILLALTQCPSYCPLNWDTAFVLKMGVWGGAKGRHESHICTGVADSSDWEAMDNGLRASAVNTCTHAQEDSYSCPATKKLIKAQLFKWTPRWWHH